MSWSHYLSPFPFPLLKSSLEELCRASGLQWVEGEASCEALSERQLLTSIPRKHPDLRDGLQDVIALCREAKDSIEPQGILYRT